MHDLKYVVQSRFISSKLFEKNKIIKIKHKNRRLAETSIIIRI